MDYIVVEGERPLFAHATIQEETSGRARSFEQFDSASTNTVANTTSLSHSSQYTPVSSAEVGPQAKEPQRDIEATLAPVPSHNEEEADRKRRKQEGSASHPGCQMAQRAVLPIPDDDDAQAQSETTTQTPSVSDTSLGEHKTAAVTSNGHGLGESHRAFAGVYGGERDCLGTAANEGDRDVGARAETTELSSMTPPTAEQDLQGPTSPEPSRAGDNEEEEARVDSAAAAHDEAEDEAHAVEEEDVSKNRTVRPSISNVGGASRAGVVTPKDNQGVDITTSAFQPATVSAYAHSSQTRTQARLRKSCTPPAAVTAALELRSELGKAPSIANPLPAEARVPLKCVEPAFAEEGVIALLSFLCEENRTDATNIPSSVFHSHCLPPMTVRNYVKRVVTYSNCSVEALLCSLILLLKYSLYSQHAVTTFNVHRLFLASIVLTVKLRDDQFYSNKYYASIGGIKPTEMNRLEMTFLARLNWFISIREEEYASLVTLLESLLEVPSGAVRMPSDASVLSQFAQEHPEMVSSYDLTMDIDDVNRKVSDSEEVRRLREASTEETNAWKLERAFRRYHWRAAIGQWHASLQQNQLVTDQQYETLQSADWEGEEARWTRYRQAERDARSSTSSNGSSQWMSPLTVNPPATASWPTSTLSATPTRRTTAPAAHNAAVGLGSAISSTHKSGGGAAGGVTAYPRYTNYPDYVQQSDTYTANGVRYNSNHIGSSQRAYANVGVPSFHNVAFSAANVEQPHARRASPSTLGSNSGTASATTGNAGNSTGIYGRGGLQSAAPPHQSHHAFSAWSQQRKVAAATTSTTEPSTLASGGPTTPGSRLNANAQPYSYVSSRQKRLLQQQQQQQAGTASCDVSSTAASPHYVDAHEESRSASWRSPTDSVPPTLASSTGASGVAAQFPAIPCSQHPEALATTTDKSTVAFCHFSNDASGGAKNNTSSNNGGVHGSGHNSSSSVREEAWHGSRRPSAGSVGLSASMAGKKRRKPPNFVDY